MKRNMEQIAKSAVINTNYEVSSKELLTDRNGKKRNRWGMGRACNCFQIWVCLGRQSRKECRKNEAAKRKQNQRIRIKGADNSVPIIFSCKFRINMVYVKCEYLIIAS